jgi:crotonobetainyl-CoA:carnitine CoA-transferase CaiB-like acyl-CoA transferase
MLSCYRVLDLTDEKAAIYGKALADFGADVINVEKPGGDPARFRGTFYQDKTDPEKNLDWFAFNVNKKSITLDIETVEGKEVFKKLAALTDIVIESFKPGYLDSLGLGYPVLSAINPGIILTSISGFGQEGPYRTYDDPDIVVRALGGLIYSVGYEDRPPLTTTYRHTHMIGVMYGTVGTLTALYQRASTGKGQHVDASAQQAGAIVCSAEVEGPYALSDFILSRHGGSRGSVTLQDGTVFYNTLIWPCRDGHIAFNPSLNPTAAKSNMAFMDSIRQHGIDIGFMNDVNWGTITWSNLTLKQARELLSIIGKFFLNHTKDELLELAIKHRFQLNPCTTAEDVLKHKQLAARDFWKDIEHVELGRSLRYPGEAVKMTEKYIGPRHRAPHIGEHNMEIYQGLLGLSQNEMDGLTARRTI